VVGEAEIRGVFSLAPLVARLRVAVRPAALRR
jgi:hypothetical protein